MKAKKIRKAGWLLGSLLAIFVYLVFAGVSWIATCGIIKLITLCFGWTFNWLWATGIWLVLYLLKSTFSSNSSKK